MKAGRAFQCMIVLGKKVLECGYLSVCQSVDVSGLPTVWCEIIGGWDCDKVIGDLVRHAKATVDASLISVIAVYGNKEEQPHRGNLWVSIITYSLGHLT